MRSRTVRVSVFARRYMVDRVDITAASEESLAGEQGGLLQASPLSTLDDSDVDQRIKVVVKRFGDWAAVN